MRIYLLSVSKIVIKCESRIQIFLPISGTELTKSSPDFNTHFLVEGIKLRHVCDWALLLHNEQDKINWKEFYKWTDELHYTKFANALTAISTQYFGLKLHNDDVGSEALHCDSIMDDMFYEESFLIRVMVYGRVES